MKQLVCLTLCVMLLAVLVSCAGAGPTPARVEGMLNPGDKIGSMTVREHSRVSFGRDLRMYCGEYFPAQKEPSTTTMDCEVPSISSVRIDFGWGAKDLTLLEASWSAMTWALHIDEEQINLQGFDQWAGTWGGQTGRGWLIALEDLSPGKHTLHLSWTSGISTMFLSQSDRWSPQRPYQPARLPALLSGITSHYVIRMNC